MMISILFSTHCRFGKCILLTLFFSALLSRYGRKLLPCNPSPLSIPLSQIWLQTPDDLEQTAPPPRHYIQNTRLVYSPAPVPQHGGIHQADENKVAITSSGNRVTCLWICSKLSTRARNAPTVKSTRPRRIRLAARTSCREP